MGSNKGERSIQEIMTFAKLSVEDRIIVLPGLAVQEYSNIIWDYLRLGVIPSDVTTL